MAVCLARVEIALETRHGETSQAGIGRTKAHEEPHKSAPEGGSEAQGKTRPNGSSKRQAPYQDQVQSPKVTARPKAKGWKGQIPATRPDLYGRWRAQNQGVTQDGLGRRPVHVGRRLADQS